MRLARETPSWAACRARAASSSSSIMICNRFTLLSIHQISDGDVAHGPGGASSLWAVDFELSEDQQALRDAARDLLDDLASPPRVRAHIADGALYDATLWRAIVQQGWMGIALPEAAGGLGLGPVELAVVL